MLKYYCDNKRHLVCKPYSVENLHKMAHDLGINSGWYHAGNKPHYDIPKRRIARIMLQCTIVSPKEIVNIIHNGRAPCASPSQVAKELLQQSKTCMTL